jgi:iron complex transport system substrate-binding protein
MVRQKIPARASYDTAGFERTPAVRYQHLYEIRSSLILQPGPAALTDGLMELQKMIERWASMVNAGAGTLV